MTGPSRPSIGSADVLRSFLVTPGTCKTEKSQLDSDTRDKSVIGFSWPQTAQPDSSKDIGLVSAQKPFMICSRWLGGGAAGGNFVGKSFDFWAFRRLFCLYFRLRSRLTAAISTQRNKDMYQEQVSQLWFTNKACNISFLSRVRNGMAWSLAIFWSSLRDNHDASQWRGKWKGIMAQSSKHIDLASLRPIYWTNWRSDSYPSLMLYPLTQ